MIRFGSMSAFVDHLAKLPVAIHVAEKVGLEAATVLLRDKAKESLGTYQEAVGPLPAWRELAQSTQAERSLKGYTPNDPLLRTGDLRDSTRRDFLTFLAGAVSASAVLPAVARTAPDSRLARNEPAQRILIVFRQLNEAQQTALLNGMTLQRAGMPMEEAMRGVYLELGMPVPAELQG